MHYAPCSSRASCFILTAFTTILQIWQHYNITAAERIIMIILNLLTSLLSQCSYYRSLAQRYYRKKLAATNQAWLLKPLEDTFDSPWIFYVVTVKVDIQFYFYTHAKQYFHMQPTRHKNKTRGYGWYSRPIQVIWYPLFTEHHGWFTFINYLNTHWLTLSCLNEDLIFLPLKLRSYDGIKNVQITINNNNNNNNNNSICIAP